jgi:hypothetical protein
MWSVAESILAIIGMRRRLALRGPASKPTPPLRPYDGNHNKARHKHDDNNRRWNLHGAPLIGVNYFSAKPIKRKTPVKINRGC